MDNAIEASIVKDPETVWRVRTFIEFQNEFELEGGSILRTALERCSYLFEKFHPRRRPVLWRILVIQAYLYKALSVIREEHNEDFDIRSLKTWAEDLRLKLDWRAKPEEENADYSEVLCRPFDTAEKYLSKKLAPLFKPTLSTG